MSQPISNSASPGQLPAQKPKSNVYTVMLVIALLAILVGCAFLAAEIAAYDNKISGPSVQLDPRPMRPAAGTTGMESVGATVV